MNRTRQSMLIGISILAAACIYAYPLWLETPLLEPDEGLHATISQEMLEHQEWIVPRFRGEPFYDKPILYFWAQMISLAAFGMNEAAVRLPGLMFGLLGSLTCGLLAKQLFEKSTAVFATIASMSMIIPLALAQAAAHDVALVPMTNLSLLCLWKMEQATDTKRQYRWMAAAALMIGLAILTKALIGAAIIAVGFGSFLLLSRRLSVGSVLRLAAAGLGGAVICSPWYIAMELRNNGYLYYYFVERHLLGFTTSTQRHGHQPWFYYLPWLILGATPWILYTLPLLRNAWTRRRSAATINPATLLVLCWLFGGLLFLSVAKSKLITYALPLYPAIAILSALAWQKKSDSELCEDSDVWFNRLVTSGAVFAFLVPFTALIVCGKILNTSWPLICWLSATAVSVTCILTWSRFQRKRYGESASLIGLWVGGLTVVLMTWAMPMFSEEHSERALAAWINQRGTVPEHLVLIGERPASLIFYLKPELRSHLQQQQLTAADLNQLNSAQSEKGTTVLAVTQEIVQQATSLGQQIPGTTCGQAGQFMLYELQSHPVSVVLSSRKSVQ